MEHPKEKQFELLLEEYRDVRTDTRVRVEASDKYVELSLVILGSFIAFINFVKETDRHLLIFFPIALYTLILLIIRSDYMVLNLTEYYYSVIRKQASSLLGIADHEILQWETYRYSKDLFTKKHRKLFVLFLAGVRLSIPFVLSILIAVYYISAYKKIFTIEDYIIIGLYLTGTVVVLCIICYWLSLSTKSYYELIKNELPVASKKKFVKKMNHNVSENKRPKTKPKRK